MEETVDSEGEKLKNLSERIDQAGSKPPVDQGQGAGRNVGFDFVGAVAGGGIVGALLDHAFGTTPWCLVGMIVFGFIVGIYSAWRSMQNKG